MENHYLQKQFETDQYHNQANLVYANTIVLCSLLAVVFFFIVDNALIAALQVLAVLVSGLAIWLNRRQRYGTGSLIYITLILAMTVIEVLQFGLQPGFQYYFFNLAGLIMYTNWRTWQKWAGVFVDTGLFLAVFFLTVGRTPPEPLGSTLTGVFHSLNVLLNIAGVANSAHYYITIATKAHKQVSKLAMQDYLTGLMNRTSFDAFWADVFASRQKSGQGLGILLLDIDYFKAVNDTCGHLCGDELLRQFAAILRHHTRAGDCTARYGGEEFVIVVILDRPEQLLDFAERLRRDIAGHVFGYGDKEKKVTTSIGALYVQPSSTLGQNQALEQADKLLYQAKSEGRNRVIFEIA